MTTQLNDTDIQGKQSVSRDHNVGGNLHVEGHGTIDHDLKVGGVLSATEIAGLEGLLEKLLKKLADGGNGLASAAEVERLIKELKALIDGHELRFLSRETEDRAKGLIRFLEGVEFGEFLSGITGRGGRIDKEGNGEMQSLVLHRFLEVPELRYNRVSITVGNEWRSPGGGIIENCVPDRDEFGNLLMTGTVTLHLEDGEIGTVAEDDICMGIFHNEGTPEHNSGLNLDDSMGNFRFAGFCTVYFRISEILNHGNNKVFRYVLRPVSSTWHHTYHPCEAMHFVGYGNFTNKERQTSRYSTRTYERYLKDVNDWEFTAANIAAQFGDLSNLSVFGIMMTGYSAYLNNIFMTGTLEQVQAAYPRLEIDNQGDYYLAYGEKTQLTCRAFRGWEDVTDKVISWSVTRDSGDPIEDAAWALKPKAQNFNGSIEICLTAEENDLGNNPYSISTIFTFKAIINDDTEATAQITYK